MGAWISQPDAAYQASVAASIISLAGCLFALSSIAACREVWGQRGIFMVFIVTAMDLALSIDILVPEGATGSLRCTLGGFLHVWALQSTLAWGLNISWLIYQTIRDPLAPPPRFRAYILWATILPPIVASLPFLFSREGYFNVSGFTCRPPRLSSMRQAPLVVKILANNLTVEFLPLVLGILASAALYVKVRGNTRIGAAHRESTVQRRQSKHLRAAYHCWNLAGAGKGWVAPPSQGPG
jgi:hypothetical protein